MPISHGFSIGALAARAGVNVETIRYYQRQGLLREPVRPSRGARQYTVDTAERVGFIKAAQSWGFALTEIAELLRLEDGTGCDEARRIAEKRLATVTAHLRDLRSVQAALRAAVAGCRGRAERLSCPLVASLRARRERRSPRTRSTR